MQALSLSAAAFLILGMTSSVCFGAATFREIFSPGGGSMTFTGVSADGSVVVGVGEDANGDSQAFRWTASGGAVELPGLVDPESFPPVPFPYDGDGVGV
ncbi:MAG TPA: hypothetical protein VGJ26_15560, partial [Pirellulales bacterium]